MTINQARKIVRFVKNRLDKRIHFDDICFALASEENLEEGLSREQMKEDDLL